MRLNVKRLKLTDREASKQWRGNVNSQQASRDVANAQIAKALWGLAKQMHIEPGDSILISRHDLIEALEKEGIPKPE